KTPENPHPDVVEPVDPATLHWQGMHELFTKISQQSLANGHKLYHAMWKKGLTNTELDNLYFASSTAEKYDHGYWLKEKIFRLLDKKLAEDQEQQKKLRKCYFTGDYAGVIQVIEALNPHP